MMYVVIVGLVLSGECKGIFILSENEREGENFLCSVTLLIGSVNFLKTYVEVMLAFELILHGVSDLITPLG